MIKAADLIRGFQIALDDHWGYIYGMTHEIWTEAKQESYIRQYSGDPDRKTSCEYGGKWAGHWVTDCSGLFHYWFMKLGSSIPHGSNSIWNGSCVARGQLSRGERTDGQPLLPGTAVFTSSGERHNHIGLYTGNGLVIEAQGTQAGVITSLISNKKWTHWGKLKGVEYQEEKEEGKMAKVVLPTGASGSTVNMRESPNKSSKIIKKVPVGSKVDVLEDKGQWCFIDYREFAGWMMSDYLEYGGGEGESGDEMIQVPVSQLKAIHNLIGEWLA